MNITRVILGLCLLLVATGAALGQEVDVDWTRGANFLNYRTYAWGQCADLGESPLWQERIIQNIDYQLARKGFRKAQPGEQPDVIVSYRSDVRERVINVGYDYGYGLAGWGFGPGLGWGPSWGWGWGGAPVIAEPIVQREFVMSVDLVDARQNRPIWNGVATDTISRKSEKNIKRLRRAVDKLFRNYPHGD